MGESLQKHIRIHNGEKPFKCDSCTYKASDPSSLSQHYYRHHSSSLKVVKEKRPNQKRKHIQKTFECHWPGCNYKNATLQGLNIHYNYQQQKRNTNVSNAMESFVH